jgi:hypothetical protein
VATTTNSIIDKLLGWLPGWLGFVIIIAAGLAAIVAGASSSSAGLIAIGAWAVVSAVLAWVAGATSKAKVNPLKRSFGGSVAGIPQWTWLVIAVLLVVAIVIAFVA